MIDDEDIEDFKDPNSPSYKIPKIIKARSDDFSGQLSLNLGVLEKKYSEYMGNKAYEKVPMSFWEDAVDMAGLENKKSFGVPEFLDDAMCRPNLLRNYLRPKPQYWAFVQNSWKDKYKEITDSIMAVKKTYLFKALIEELPESEFVNSPDFEDFLRCFLLLCLHHYFADIHILSEDSVVFTSNNEKFRDKEMAFRNFLNNDDLVEKAILADLLVLKHREIDYVDCGEKAYYELEDVYAELLSAIKTIRKTSIFTKYRPEEAQLEHRRHSDLLHYDYIELSLWLGSVVSGSIPSGSPKDNDNTNPGIGLRLADAVFRDIKLENTDMRYLKNDALSKKLLKMKRNTEFKEVGMNAIELHKTWLKTRDIEGLIKQMFDYFETDFLFGYSKRRRLSTRIIDK